MTWSLSKLLAIRPTRPSSARGPVLALMVSLGIAGTATLPLTPLPVHAQEKGPAPNAQGDIVKRFHDRVADYIKLQQKLEKSLTTPRKDEDPGTVDAHKKALAAQIRDARKAAKRGDLFADAGDVFRVALSKDQASRSAGEKREARKEVPVRQPPAINADYPTAVPLATVPALLLKQLPPLPDGLEYRFMERDLILHDTHANIVADVLPDVLPER